MRLVHAGFHLAVVATAIAAAATGCSADQSRPAETSGAPVPSSSASPSPTTKAAVPSLSPSGPQSISPGGSGPRPATPMPGKGPNGGQ